MENVLLVEPKYYAQYPPLGLLKLATYHRLHGRSANLIRGIDETLEIKPERIEITSLFTYAWKPVHESIKYYHKRFPSAAIRLGGIYASLHDQRIQRTFPYVKIHRGLYRQVENLMPAYDLLENTDRWKGWNSSILFTSRGCNRRCPFCVVPKLEGGIRTNISDIERFIYPDHNKIILWDNNFLASPEWKKSLKKLRDIGLEVDFNQGLDARLIDEEKAALLSELPMSILRMAYDRLEYGKTIGKAIELLSSQGISRRRILLYMLYNFYDQENRIGDNPPSFLQRVREILRAGCISYPMRYEPPTSLTKNRYISPLWTIDQLELVAKARRVIGFGGAFPPYERLIQKLNDADSFEDAFSLRPRSV